MWDVSDEDDVTGEADASDTAKGEKGLSRRTFLKRSLIVGGLAASGGATISELLPSSQDARAARTAAARRRAPNVLVVMVDQMRSDPHRTPSGPIPPGITPNIEALARESVRFGSHYTASNDCSPARAALVTGLYTHQTGCMITGGSTLDPGFPTWGTLMRQYGYSTWWFGKWHLTHGDNRWTVERDKGALERYSFSGGTYPSPDGSPGQGSRVDPFIATQFEDWFVHAPEDRPWCTTVSFVNPHDIAWWYLWTDRVPVERSAPPLYGALPANFQTPGELEARGKPRLQRSFQETAASSFGPVSYAGPAALRDWLPFRDLYAKLQRSVDDQVGRVLSALASRPRLAANTVVLFTSDHGEYSAAHGLRGKGAAVYEEGIRVPLLVKDPRGVLTRGEETLREQLTSSVDVAPLLLSIASGSSDWRGEHRHRHLAGRLDLTPILLDPSASGRPYVLHATDEIVTEFAIEEYAADAPLHIVSLRTKDAKYATYSNWRKGTITPLSEGMEAELYDYSTRRGRMEMDSVAGESPLEPALKASLERAVRQELRAPLPKHLHAAQRRGIADFLHTARKDAREATRQRRRKMEKEGMFPAVRDGRGVGGGSSSSEMPRSAIPPGVAEPSRSKRGASRRGASGGRHG